jgi:hypothetical protein
VSNVIPFKKPRVSESNKGKTLCKSGFHQWEILKEQQFDVKQGRLVTVSRCKRCAKTIQQAL